MTECKHDTRFHLMLATNGCCACELEAIRARLAEAEAELKQLREGKGSFRRLLRNMRRADEAKGGRDE